MDIYYDTHAHLTYPDFADELPDLIQRAQLAGIKKIVSVGTDLESSRACIALSERFEEVYAVVGWHPGDAMDAPDDIRPALRDLAKHPKVVALGETGLDYYRLPSKHSGNPQEDLPIKAKQAALFQQHLEVAVETGLNCVIHQRDSLEDTIQALEPFAARVRGVFHCFSGDVVALDRILAMNSIVSFTGILTFKNAETVRTAIKTVPAGKFMLETDCPFLAPVPYRGRRCEPAYVTEMARVAAEVRNCTGEELSRTTCACAHGFFRGLA